MTATNELTARELSVLRAIAQGLSQNAIGRALGYAEDSNCSGVARTVYAKLGATNAPNAVYLACQRGLLSMPAVDPGREEDDSRAVPPGAEVFHVGCPLGRTIADTHPTSKES